MLIRRVELKPRHTLLLKGPAEIAAQGAGLSALCKDLPRGESAWIRLGKIMPFEADQEVAVKIVLRRGAEWRIESGRVGAKIWRGVVDEVFAPDRGCRRIVIVGATDAGKSTLSTYLLNTALSRGLVAGVLDEDVGQGDLAPPGCVGGAVLSGPVFDLRDVEASFVGFVGAISPRGFEGIVRSEVSRIERRLEASGIGFLVVNTDGYVAAEGIGFKAGLIRVLDPDVVVCFEDPDGERVLFDRLREACGCPLVLAGRSTYSAKSVSERAGRRMSQYRRFLRGGRLFRIDLRRSGIRFLGCDYRGSVLGAGGRDLLKMGEEDRRLVLHRGVIDDVVVVGEAVEVPLSSLAGMFMGLGSGGEVLRFVRCVDVYPDFTIDVLTDALAGFDTVFLSLIRLREGLRREDVLPVIRSDG